MGLGASLMEVRGEMQFPMNVAPENAALQPITFMNKSLISAETHYSNIEREALGIAHCLEKFHHYCLTHEVYVITGYKLPIPML